MPQPDPSPVTIPTTPVEQPQPAVLPQPPEQPVTNPHDPEVRPDPPDPVPDIPPEHA